MAEEKIDYLDVDTPINGQNYCCISFLDPADVIEDKHGFYVSKFLQSVCGKENWEYSKVMKEYTDFTYKHSEQLQKEYDEKNNFKSNVRGIKIRGVYQSKQEADARASRLHKTDSNFHVFVGQVGYWLPFNPCADNIEDEHFGDDQLNDLMQKYKENNVNKDIFYEEQKREKIKAAQEERLRAEREQKAQQSLENISENEPSPEDEPTPEDEPSPEKVVEEPIGLESTQTVETSELERALSSKDPWMQRKES